MSRRSIDWLATAVIAVSGLALAVVLNASSSAETKPQPAPGDKSVATAPRVLPNAGIGATGDHFEVVFLPTKEQRAVLALADANTNAPVTAATIEIEVARPAWKGMAQPTPTPGIYVLDWNTPAEKTDVTVIVTAGDRSDLISISNVVRLSDAAAGTDTRARVGNFAAYQGIVAIVGGTIIALVAFAYGFARLRRRSGAVAAIAIVIGISLVDSRPANAHPGHEGHDEPDDKSSALAQGGSVMVPKSVQFVLEVRTARVEKRDAASHVRLVGRVVPDPDAYARVQPSQISRLLADPEHPMPRPGQWVKRGDVVAVLQPTLTAIERSEQRNALGKVETAITNARRQLERYSKLKGVVPEKDIEQAKLELERLLQEKQQLLGTSLGRELLVAPIDGQVTEIHSAPGETVTTEMTIVEIVNPAKLRVEAILFDFSIVNQIRGGFARSRHFPDETFPLKLMGSSGRVTPKDQGIHIWFSADNPKHLLKLDLPVDVFADIGTTEPVITISRDAVFEIEGQSMVLIKIAPESFKAQPVTIRRSSGGDAEVTEGLKPGDRVVVQGAQQLRRAR